MRRRRVDRDTNGPSGFWICLTAGGGGLVMRCMAWFGESWWLGLGLVPGVVHEGGFQDVPPAYLVSTCLQLAFPPHFPSYPTVACVRNAPW